MKILFQKTIREVTTEFILRFWSKVQRGNPDECWLYVGQKNRGYGVVYLGKHGRDKAPRIAWQLANKKRITKRNPFIRHSCDNPPCCNPKHLIAGTPKQNTQDMMARRRGVTLEQRRFSAKLTPANVRLIRKLSQKGISQTELALRFNLSRPSICEAVHFKTWKEIA